MVSQLQRPGILYVFISNRSVVLHYLPIFQISLGVLCHFYMPCGSWLPLSAWQTGSRGEDASAVPVGSSSENTRQTQHDSNLYRSRHEGHFCGDCSFYAAH